MKDYLLQIKIKNGPMMSMMRVNGIETAAELSRASGVDQSTIGRYLNLQQVPFGVCGGWRAPVERIAKCLKVPPEMLFPEQHLTKALKRNTIEGEVTLEEMGELVSTAGINYISEEIEKETQDELYDKLEKSMGTLDSRERKILEMKCGGKTYDQVAEDFSVTRERIRQIEQRALRKLRHPSRMGKTPPIQREEREAARSWVADQMPKFEEEPTQEEERKQAIERARTHGGRWHHLIKHD
jgi:RNA polymerase sigma factor (sigma-70 family)